MPEYSKAHAAVFAQFGITANALISGGAAVTPHNPSRPDLDKVIFQIEMKND